MYLYHATDKKNEGSIIKSGLLPPNGFVIYFSESEEEAVKFVSLRAFTDMQVIVIRVNKNKLDKKYLAESFDHSPYYFKAKVFTYEKPLKIPMIDKCAEYTIIKGDVQNEK
jgi:hypothetical protein